jgi:NADPH-dependent glutamate synthase beta subunit-like oxidoreductase
MRGYIHLLGQGKIGEAIRLIREESPLPAITGHVCFHPCEDGCARNEVDEPVNINGLERYVADYWLNEKADACLRIHDKPVAVIGSGPAGLAAAYVLVRKGYPVTVFDGNNGPGGMLRAGIPDYRLPRSILDAQIGYIRDLGVDIRNGVVFGKDMTLEGLKAAGYGALLLAIGAQLSRTIDIEGAHAEGVLWGLDFLRAVKLGKEAKVGPRTVVIGGGNVAVDAAMTALRLGSEKVRIVCLESQNEMPAHREVLDLAVAEGVDISPGWGPRKVIEKRGRVAAVEVVRCLSVFDQEGNFSPCLDDGTKGLFEADSVIFAIGEIMDVSGLPPELETRAGHILADPLTLETNVPGVFAAGIAVGGPGSVVEAIGSGKRAALSIDRFLKGEDLRDGREQEQPAPMEKLPKETIEKRQRQSGPLLSIEERKGNFREIKGGLEREAADQEQRRCMACGSKAFIRYLDDCMTCYTCEKDCPREAIHVSPGHVSSVVSCWG